MQLLEGVVSGLPMAAGALDRVGYLTISTMAKPHSVSSVLDTA